MRIQSYIPQTGQIADLLRNTAKHNRPIMTRAILAKLDTQSISISFDWLLRYSIEKEDPKHCKLTIDLPESHNFALAVAHFCTCLKGLIVFVAISDSRLFASAQPQAVLATNFNTRQTDRQTMAIDIEDLAPPVDETIDFDSYIDGYFAETHKTHLGVTK
jgi:hypothetical protein